MPAFWVNDTPLERLGFRVVRVRGMGDPLGQRVPTTAVPGRAGRLAVSTRAGEVSPRTVTVTLTIRPRTSLADLEAAMVKLYALCGGGLVELREARDPGKALVGYLAGGEDLPYDPQYLAADPASLVTLRFTCDDPARYAVSPTLVGLATSRAACPLGPLPVAPILRIFGAVTNPTVSIRTAGGVLRQTMGFTIALAATDWLEVNCETGVIQKSVSGVVSDAYGTWTTKSDGFLVLDPHDGDPVTGTGPTLELSGGSGEACYWRAYA
jgi:hypothetical protein